MIRRRARVDANQPGIVKALRQIPGVRVRSLSALGQGIPDLLVSYNRHNFLVEIKDPRAAKSDRQLTPDQVRFFEEWTGQCAKVETLEEVLEVIGVLRLVPRETSSAL